MQVDSTSKKGFKIRYAIACFFALLLLGSLLLFINRGKVFEEPIFGDHLHAGQYMYPLSFPWNNLKTLESAFTKNTLMPAR